MELSSYFRINARNTGQLDVYKRQIKGIGLDTAKQVLNAPRNLLIEKADLEEETVDPVSYTHLLINSQVL